MTNSLLACFEADAGGRLESFDWDSHGVSLPFAIFITGRCGSTLLTNILQDSGLCGRPDEVFNEMVIPSLNTRIHAGSFVQYFEGIVNHFKHNQKWGFEIDPLRFRVLDQTIDFLKVFPPAITRFLWMTRRDIVSQAWSYAQAKKTGLWQMFSDGTEMRVPKNNAGSSRLDDGIGDKEWWREIMNIVFGEKLMTDFFRRAGLQPYRLDYESLVCDRLGTVTRVLHALGCSAAEIESCLPWLEDRTVRQVYSDRYAELARFLERYGELLEEIDQNRGTIDSGYLRKNLNERHRLGI